MNHFIGDAAEALVDVVEQNLGFLLDSLSFLLGSLHSLVRGALLGVPDLVVLAALVILAYFITRKVILSASLLAALLLVWWMGLWNLSMETLSLVLVAAATAIAVGVPLGILCTKNDHLNAGMKVLLDFMQTMPSFVYLIPVVIFFGLGNVPGMVATVVFAVPPVVRLTNLGIRQVPKDIDEAAEAFGATPLQKLLQVQLPLARPTIMAGVNQCIMLALSMVVIASMIGARGLGSNVLVAIQRVDIGMGFEAGLAIVVLAIVLDRITQGMNKTV